MIYIDHDHIDSGQAGVTVYVRPTFALQRLAFGAPSELHDENGLVAFRLYDGDGRLYYEGRLGDDNEAENQLAALRWGETMAGATELHVKRGRSWVRERELQRLARVDVAAQLRAADAREALRVAIVEARGDGASTRVIAATVNRSAASVSRL
jgi:hypothetical protein